MCSLKLKCNLLFNWHDSNSVSGNHASCLLSVFWLTCAWLLSKENSFKCEKNDYSDSETF
jgi:hypothetical protein